MAGISDTNPYSKGVYDAVKGALGLFSGINKTPVAGDQSVTAQDEYESSYSEEKVIDLITDWKKLYEKYYADIRTTQDTAFSYWIGRQNTDAMDEIEGVRIVDNRIFNALETFLPIATRANPEPLVAADNSPEGQALAKDVKDALSHLADKLKLRMKLKAVTRNWALMRLGVVCMDYDYIKDEIDVRVIHPKRMLLDPNGSIDDAGFFTGQWVGETMQFSASKLIEMFPNKRSTILSKAKNKQGTMLEIVKWWYQGTDTFFTLDQTVLAKKKNPHWNWDGTVTRTGPSGQPVTEEVQGTNHFPLPMAPYIFLSIFKTGLQPHDDTSLILQNITLQDQINKRYKQIDKNVDSQNNGLVVDGNKMDQAQAAEAASALRKGASIRVMGNVNDAFQRSAAPPLAPDIFKTWEISKSELDGIFGITGSTAQGIQQEDTARGKILVNQLDASRIGGGITEFIEQVADSIYNWMVQMMVVHYDNDHYINAIGMQEGQEMVTLKNTRFMYPLTVTVKEGSLIPKDPLTQRNEAMDLWSGGVIDPLNLYKKLEFPDPVGATQQLILWQLFQKGAIPPQAYLPGFQIDAAPPGAMPPPPGVGGPAVNSIGPMGEQAPQAQGTQPPEQVQGKQLLQQVPIK